MIQQRKQRGVIATARGYELIEQVRANGLNNEGKRLTYECIASMAGVDIKTVGRFFRKEPVDRSSAVAIINALGLETNNVIPPHETILEKSIEDSEESKQFLLDEIKAKEEEIERLRQQGSLYESEIKKLEVEKADIEISVQRLDEFIAILKGIGTEFNKRIEASREGASWLNERRQRELAREAAKHVFNEYPNLKEASGSLDSDSLTKQFALDIRKYLHLIYHCLYKGSYNLLHKAKIESKIPFTLEPTAYVEAFKFIKENKIPKDMHSKVARQVEYYLDYLIKLI